MIYKIEKKADGLLILRLALYSIFSKKYKPLFN